jgi:glycosyltransferase involved in cell wall biosynthesis
MIISVILPVYNGEHTIKRAIFSVLNDLESEDELVICNDASTDETLRSIEEINDNRIVLLSNQTNLGISGTLNNALCVSKGDIISRMDADDIWVNGRRKFVSEFFSNDSNLDKVLFGSYHIFNNEEKVIKTPSELLLERSDILQLMLKGDFLHPTMNIMKSKMKEYDVELCGIEDIFLYTNLLNNGMSFYKTDRLFLEYFREERKYDLRERLSLQMKLTRKLQKGNADYSLLIIRLLFVVSYILKSLGLYKNSSKFKQ